MRDQILDHIHDDEMQKLKAKVQGTYQTISVDGWTSPTNEALVGVALGADLLAVGCAADKHTAEHLAAFTTETIRRIMTTLDCTVAAVVTDGASAMESMRARLPSDLAVFHYRCGAHALHLCVGDFFRHDGRNKVLSTVRSIASAFKNSQALSQGLRLLGLCRPPLPSDTRWAQCAPCTNARCTLPAIRSTPP